MPHLLTPGETAHDMREFYAKHNLLATSQNADIALILSHIAYHSGRQAAAFATVSASRGHSYRVKGSFHASHDVIVRISDHFDHIQGITGWFEQASSLTA